MCQDFSALDTDSIRISIWCESMVITATTVWLLLLTTPGGVMSLQSIHQTPEACEAARDLLAEQVSPRRTYKSSRYYAAECRPKERER